MKTEIRFTKMDFVVVLFCIFFLFMNLGAIPGGARRRAKKAACLSNLFKWGEVFQMYAEDNDGSTISDEMYRAKWASICGFEPIHPGDENGYPGPDCWASLLGYYYQDRNLLLCPMAKKAFDWHSWGSKDMAWDFEPCTLEFADGGTGSYGINDWCGNEPRHIKTVWGYPTRRCWRTFNVRGSDNIPLLTDCVHIGYYFEDDLPPPKYETCQANEAGRICIDRHGGGTICGLFMDFSVRSIGLKELWTLKWNKSFDTCNMYTLCGGATSEDWDEWAPWMKDFQEY